MYTVLWPIMFVILCILAGGNWHQYQKSDSIFSLLVFSFVIAVAVLALINTWLYNPANKK